MRALAIAEIGPVSGGYTDEYFRNPYQEPGDEMGGYGGSSVNDYALRAGAVRAVSRWVVESVAWDILSTAFKAGNKSERPYGTTDGPGSTSDGDSGSDRGG